jgi:hypothetical protein
MYCSVESTIIHYSLFIYSLHLKPGTIMDEVIDDLTPRLIPLAIGIIATAIIILIVNKAPRTKGIRIEYHIGFFVASSLFLLFIPEYFQSILFCPAGVLVIGTLIPIYESIKAAVSIDREDYVAWLQFWLASGTFTYVTEWMDVVAEHYPSIAEHWYEFEFLTLLWLLLPFTDGSTFLFDKITGPLFGGMAERIKNKTEARISLFMIMINSSFLWIMWFTFLTLDEEARRFIVIAVGTVYPIAASTVACTTRGSRDDTFWLTYWACFSILFIMMDYLEDFIGKIRGFYSICLCATVYLFLPMVR